MRLILFLLFATTISGLMAQVDDTTSNLNYTAKGVRIGGYGEVHYNQPLSSETKNNGKLDVHRMVLLFGYGFSEKTQFVSEIEFEHVKELYVEQAYLSHTFNNYLSLRAGLLLIPMGIINQYHEPPTFNGVERPGIDKKITPTTWREIGFGLTGTIQDISLKYQLYLVNGFNGYNGLGKLNGKDGLRGGRQKGAESYISAPNYTTRFEFYGINGLKIGASGYYGKSQSTLYDGVDKNNSSALEQADSSVVGIGMFGIDAQFKKSGIAIIGQLYYVSISNTEAYNEFTKNTDGSLNDLGSAMMGYYVEAGYDILSLVEKSKMKLTGFVRYENYNTHTAVASGIVKNDAYNVSSITPGITLELVKGAVVKSDIMFSKSKDDDEFSKTLNLGIGIWF